MAKQLQKQQEKQGLGAVQGQKNSIESTEAAYPMSYTAGYENGYEAYPPLYGEGEVAEVERVEAGQENNEQGVVETTGVAPLQQTPALALNAEESLDGMSAGLQVESSESSSAGDAAGAGGSGSGTVGPTPPPIAPTDDPDFNAVEEKIVAGGEQYKEHEAAASLSKNAELAAPLAEGEREGLAEQGQINKMDAQEPAAFNAEQFVGALMNRIAAIMPKTEKEADNFERNDGLGKMSQTVSAEVGKEKQAAEHAIEGASEEAPQVGAVSARTVEQLEGPELGPVAAPVGGGAAIPDAREAVYVENVVDDRLGEIDSLMESNEVKDEQLAASNEASFLTALGEKEGAKTGSEEMKTAVRLEETGILSAAAGNSEQLAVSEMDALYTERELFLQNVLGEQEDSSAEQTAERAKVASEIHSIYERSKSEVEQQLSSLDQEVQNMFNQAAAKAKAKFLSHVQTKMAAYKAERYEGLSGAARWLGDAFTGLPEEVNAFYVEGRELYIAEMRQALYQIADHIAAGLNTAKARIQAGREEVTAYVESLPDAVRALGEKAAAAIDRSFGELDASVNSKQDALVNELAKQYTDNLAAIDAEIAAMQEANKGLIDHALEAVGGVIETIMEIKQMLTDVVNAGVEVISAILADPIGFLSNLIDGVSAGVNGFFANVSDHLLNGLIEWLTGALSGVNISLPEDIFSFAGILDLSAQILGLTWDYVREKAVYAVGEDAVSAMERSFEIFQILQTEGLAGAWEYIQGQLGNLQEVVLGGIQEFLITAVFQAGIEWIIGLLTPAGAFVKAAMAIIDIVKFFIENGSQIMALVQSIIDSLAAIAAGDVGFVAQAVEGAMASTVPILIDFLASLLGIDGLSDKVQEIVGSIRKRIDDAITGLIDKAKEWFKGNGKEKRKAESEEEVTEEDRAKHKRFAAEIEADLKKIQPKEGESFEDFRQRVQIRANELEKEYQPKLTDGIKVSIQLTSTAKEDEKDGDVDVQIKIAPNTEVLETEINLNTENESFTDLAEAIKENEDLHQPHPNIDNIEAIIGIIVTRLNATRRDGNEIWFILNTTKKGGFSHKFTFLLKEKSTNQKKGKPAYLGVSRKSGDSICASCGLREGVSSPHNVITAKHAKGAIDLALEAILVGGLDERSKETILYKHMRGLANSTGSSAPLPTKGDFQKQCEVCEGSAAGDTVGKFLAGLSLIQRANGAMAENGDTADSREMDKQFATTTSETREYITMQRIEYFAKAIRKKIIETTNSEEERDEQIYTLFRSNSSKIDEFIAELTTSITRIIH